MDHHEQHHQHHQKQREEKKREHALHEKQQERKPIHPGWFVAGGALLIFIAIMIWTFVIW